MDTLSRLNSKVGTSTIADSPNEKRHARTRSRKIRIDAIPRIQRAAASTPEQITAAPALELNPARMDIVTLSVSSAVHRRDGCLLSFTTLTQANGIHAAPSMA